VKNRIFFKLLAVFLIVIAATAAILDVMLGGAWQASIHAEIERNLAQKTQLFAHRVETDKSHSLPEIAAQEGIAQSGYRLIVNCNADGGQEVYHLHLHLLGGKPLGPMVSV